LDQCAEYIAQRFEEAGATVEFQAFPVGGKQYRNVIGRFGADKHPRVVVGAHYDTCGEQPGAGDNASGIAALIELAGLLGRSPRTNAVDVVAYVLEEPPFFRTPQMGSAIHAKSIAGAKVMYRGIIVLEMVGYFKDDWGSQSYPTLLLRLMYPNRGNFIGVVGRWDQGDWVKAVKVGMKGTTDLPVVSIRAPSVIPGIDFSDHLNYWPYGIKALMVTDTAFYRNKAYHSSGDTAERLDYNRMVDVAVAVFGAIESM
jgi:Zn-dependent M28 family amino/carboxypeptidase